MMIGGRIMKKIEIFDPAMCCSTGVCGPSVDPELLRVATVISALGKMGAEIQRHNAASDPDGFVRNEAVASVLEKEGADVLPVTLLDGKIVKTKEYPTNGEFAEWLGVELYGEADEGEGSCCCESGCC
jgi:hypothetical protein